MRQRTTTKANGAGPASVPDAHLTPQQAAVCDVLAGGATITDAAAAVGVDRATVSQWTNHHAAFQASLNSRRQELWAGHVERLRGLLPKALAVLEEELQGEGPGRLQAATTVFRLLGLYSGIGAPTGPTTVEEVEQAQRAQALAQAQTQVTADDIRIARASRSAERFLADLATGPGLEPPV